jgi:hypothetical protein
MEYYLFHHCKKCIELLDKYDTVGVNYSENPWSHYSGNFWWMKWSYGNTIKIESEKQNRFNAELDYIQNGIGWKPYSPYNIETQNPYLIEFKREEYAK